MSVHLHRWRNSPALVISLSLIVLACSGTAQTPVTGGSPSAVAPSAPASADAPSAAHIDEVCARAAKEEGELVYWNSLDSQETATKMAAVFSQRYPGIQLEPFAITPSDAVTRIVTESAAGKQITPDAQLGGGADVLQALVDRDLIDTEISWAADGVPQDLVSATNTVRVHRSLAGLVYNSDKLTADELPSTWEGLIDPKWKGRVSVDPRGRPWDYASVAWGEAKTLDYVQRLKDVVQPLVIKGGTPALTSLLAGETEIATGARNGDAYGRQAMGEPIAFKFMDVAPSYDQFHFAFKGARHPLAAECWIAWFNTQADLFKQLEQKVNETPDLPASAQLVLVDTPETIALVQKVGKGLAEILTE